MGSNNRRIGMNQLSPKILSLVCIAVLCTILTLGLWPFHAPRNDVSWLGTRNGLHFGKYGTLISSGALEAAPSDGSELSGSIEIWLQSRRGSQSGTLLAFCAPEDPVRFSLRQSLTDLQFHAAIRDDRNQAKAVNLYVNRLFGKPVPMFITIVAGGKGLVVYIDGIWVWNAPQFRLAPNQLTGRIVVGDSPGQPDSWKGQMLGLAIYDRALTEAQLRKHYQTWTHTGRPEIQKDEGNDALYLFDERGGTVVHNHVNSGVDLSIPEKYVVLYQMFLQPFWTEFELSQSYWSSILKNIVGFIPLGFCFCARFSVASRVKRVALTTVLLGALASLTIEILQSYLPTRDSGTTDIITNTLGTGLGVFAFRSKAAQALFAKLGHWNQALAAGRRGD
jgi:VanZ family protein